MPVTDATAAGTKVISRIRTIRGLRVILDADLATLYGVTTARLNQQVRRNRERFPADFILELSAAERANLMLQSATSSWGGRRKAPLAFTEHGAIMAATVLNSPRAVSMTVYVVRGFVQLRTVLASRPDLAARLSELEEALAALDRGTRVRFQEVYAAIRALGSPPATTSRPIGFTAPIE